MEHKERIALYLSGFADRETEIQTENAILKDAGALEKFIEASEQLICAAPSGFTGSVMRGIRLQNMPTTSVKVPVLSRKLCAAACFCSAAAIMLFTVSGFSRQFLDFVFTHSSKLNEILSTLKF